ncbi:MAG: hypothetical protein A2Y33_03605 [Spirochaetes bacterium GWF1_51_8]|nr:MAG: hypothetical protein A2Y33_03605 [Spirochaetes bacterium GWF1_51_8]
MKKDVFTIKPETQISKYRMKSAKSLKNLTAAVIAAGLLMILGNGLNGQSEPEMGIVAYNPQINTVKEFQEIAKPIMESHFIQKITKDVPVTIQSKKGEVKFTAELYNKDKKIAVEWVNYDPKKIGAGDNKYLDSKEISSISNYHCGNEFVILIYGKDYESVQQEFDTYFEWYKKEYSVKKPVKD